MAGGDTPGPQRCDGVGLWAGLGLEGECGIRKGLQAWRVVSGWCVAGETQWVVRSG